MNPGHPLSALEMTRLALFKMYNQAGLPPVSGPPTGPPGGPLGGPLGAAGINEASLQMGRAMVEQQARALQAAQREVEAREKDLVSKSPISLDKSLHKDSDSASKRSKESSEKSRGEEDDDLSPPPMKRERQDSLDHRNGSPLGMGAHIRIANRGK